MRKNLRYLVLILIIGSLLLGNKVVFANAEIDGLKREKEAITEKMQEQEEQINNLKGEIYQVGQEMQRLDRQISKSQSELFNLNVQIEELENAIKKNEDNLGKAKENLSQKQEELYVRLREQYKSGNIIYLEVFMGSSNMVEMLTKMNIVESVIDQDKELMNFTSKQIKFIEDTETQLKIQREEREQKRQAELAKKAELEAANAEKLKYMQVLQENKAYAEGQYDEFVSLTVSIDEKIVKLEQEMEARRKAEEEARRKAEEARKRSSGGNYVPSGNGALRWPVPGYSSISSYYGMRIHPIFKTQKFHAGIDIPAPSGSRIIASSSGIVIYSGWQGGYGNCVMVSHGNNLVTVYAHNSSLAVRVGDYVDAGQTIAYCGSTGYSTGPHLHFEVRTNGKTTDPLGWF